MSGSTPPWTEGTRRERAPSRGLPALGLLALLLLACTRPLPVPPVPAAAAPAEGGEPLPPRLERRLQRGWRISPEEAARRFPELGIETDFVHAVELRARRAWLDEEGGLVVDGLELRFLARGWGPLEIGTCTDVLLTPSSVWTLHREEGAAPPGGRLPPWYAESRVVLAHRGPLLLGQYRYRD